MALRKEDVAVPATIGLRHMTDVSPPNGRSSVMANSSSPCLPIAREGDEALYLGAVGGAMRSTRRGGGIWIVVHRAGGEWTHVYRCDERAERTFHLERVAPGDARATLVSWALKAFEIENSEARAA